MVFRGSAPASPAGLDLRGKMVLRGGFFWQVGIGLAGGIPAAIGTGHLIASGRKNCVYELGAPATKIAGATPPQAE